MAKWNSLRRRRYNTYSRYSKRVSGFPRLARLAFLGVVVLVIFFFIGVIVFSFNLPSPDKVVRRSGFATKILDRNGQVLYDIYLDERRTPVSFEDISQTLKDATIAIEDKNFYVHEGFDPLGMVRGLSRLFTRGRAQGGSTLTQQLVKNVLLSPERSVFRKAREFILALQIERKYSKDQILTMYLNEAPYGGTAWGVEAASEVYFGKKAKDLNLVESAFLAGLPQRPSVYSPYSADPDAYLYRTKQVLRRMREDGYISREQEEEALKQLDELEFQSSGASFKAPHFVQYVQSLLEERYGQAAVVQGGLRVTTTLDLELQEKAQKIVSEEIEKVEALHITNGAAVVLDPTTGEILAMVGSKDFNDKDYDGQVNVTLSLRQPGSAIKPITYATALKKGYTASTLLMDTPTRFPGGANQPEYEPGNYDGKFRGPVQVRYALGNSINVPAVKMLSLVGVKDMLATAYDMGISTLKPDKETLSRVGLSVTLGGGEVRLLELTAAYSAFVNTGERVDPVAILKVEDQNGKILEQADPKPVKRVLTPEQAFIMAAILSDNKAREEVFGANSALVVPGYEVAVKTGTTNDKRDNWTLGGNSNAMVGVWVGNNDNSEMKQVASGVTGASPIWRRIIMEALSDKPKVTFDPPSGIVSMEVDSVSGYPAHDGFPSRTEYFVKGTEPSGEDPVHVKLKVCKRDGKLATPADIGNGDYEEKEYFVFKEEDPFAAAGETNRWQEGILAWLSTQADERYHPPSEYCGTENPINVSFVSPPHETSNLSNNIEVKIDARSTSDITLVELRVDGEKVRSFTQAPFEHSLSLADGPHELQAIARDASGNEKDSRIRIGVNSDWKEPEPTPTP